MGDGWHKYVILAIVLVGVFMGVVDGSVVNIALPTITAAFGVRVAESQWVVTGYLVTMTSLLLIFGRISEYTGKAASFLTGFAIFTLGSLACGFSGNLYELIFFRVVQAAGASMVFSISAAIVVQAFPRDERGKALGLMGTTIALGGIASPILGGYIVDALGWQYVFLVNVPIGVALLLVASKYFRLEEERKARLDMDWKGSVAFVTCVVSLMVFLGEFAATLRVTSLMATLIMIFIASLAFFLGVESRRSDPLVDLSIFSIRKFTFANLSTFLFFMALYMFNLIMPFYLEVVAGYSPSGVGSALIIIPLVVCVVAPLSGYVYDKAESHRHSSFGMLVIAISFAAMAYFAGAKDMAAIFFCFALLGLGNGLFQSPNNTEVMSALAAEKSHTASSVLATVRNLGMASGVSVASILLSLWLEGNSIFTVGTPAASGAASIVLLGAGLVSATGVVTSLLR